MASRRMHTMFLLRKPCLAGLVLLGSWVGAVAQTADRTPEEHLRQVKDALVQAALQRPVAVSATQWLDASGQLRESSEFRSGMVVRGVRLLSPEENKPSADESPTERVAWLQSRDMIESACERKSINGHFPKHTVRWQLRLEGSLKPMSRWDLSQIQKNLDQVLWPQADASQDMVLVQAPAVNGSYERALAGNSRNDIPMMLRLALRPIEPTEALARSYRLDWQLVDQRSGKTWWSLQQVLNVPHTDPQVSPPGLDPQVRAQLLQAVTQSRQAMDLVLRCQAPRYELTRTSDKQWRIPAGELNGLRVGDRLMVLPSNHRPGDEWDPKQLQQVALVQIRSVNENDAQVVHYAGPQPSASGRWVAMPRLP